MFSWEYFTAGVHHRLFGLRTETDHCLVTLSPDEFRVYSREWMQRRKAAYLADKACEVCGEQRLQLRLASRPGHRYDRGCWSWTTERRTAELAKTIILCEEHWLVVRRWLNAVKYPLVHGTAKGYERGCPCAACKQAHARDRAEQRKRAAV